MTPLDDFQKRYLQELATAATVLPSLESASQAEAWASGAAAEWQALSGEVATLSSHLLETSPLGAQLIDWFEGGAAPTSDACPWIGDLDRHELTRVLKLSQVGAPEDIGLILEYSLDGQQDHDLSVSIEHGHLTAVTIGPPGLSDGIEETEDDDLQAKAVDTPIGLGMIASAMKMPISELSAASEANIPLLVRRIGSAPVVASAQAKQPLPERDRQDDLWCVGVAQSALRKQLAAPAPDQVNVAVTDFAALVSAGDPDARTVLDVAGLDPKTSTDLAGLLMAVGAYFAPVDLSAHSSAAFDALIMLEPVDWLGAVLGVVRSRSDHPPIDGAALVTFINKAPEITSTISRGEAPQIAWTFDQMLFAWEVTGVISDDGAVTDEGRWLLAQAFVTTLG